MRKYFLEISAMIGLFCATSGSEAASFNCQRASTSVEKMICSTPAINEADERLATIYNAAITSADGKAIKSEQREWLKSRNGCNDDTCLLALYRDRILVLTAPSQPSPTGIPLLILPSQADQPTPFKSREVKGTVVGYVSFGHDPAGGKYVVNEQGGGQITISYVGGFSDQESKALENLEEKKLLVKASGVIDVFTDGSASFSTTKSISIYDGSPDQKAIKSSQAEPPSQLESCVPDPAGLTDFGRSVYLNMLTELKYEKPGAQFIMGTFCDSTGSLLDRVNPIFTKVAVRKIDDAAAAAWYLKAANQGDSSARLRLCQMFFNGRGVTKDISAATDWCRKAAAQGVNEALITLREIAADDLRIRAEQGNSDAQNDLAIEYQKSNQFNLAVNLFKKAAAQKNKFAMFNLGLAFEKGLGVPQDAVQAAEWQLKSAEQGYAPAQERLGIFYTEGKGVTKDLQKAAEWNQKAGAQGLQRAQAAYETYVTERAYAHLIASAIDRFKLPQSAVNICIAGVNIGDRAPIMLPEYVAMLSESDKMLESILYEEPSLFSGEYTISFKRRADQHDQIKTISFKKVFRDNKGSIYVNQTPSGDLMPCLVASHAEFIGGRVVKMEEDIKGMVFSQMLINDLYSKLRSKARQKAIPTN